MNNLKVLLKIDKNFTQLFPWNNELVSARLLSTPRFNYIMAGPGGISSTYIYLHPKPLFYGSHNKLQYKQIKYQT